MNLKQKLSYFSIALVITFISLRIYLLIFPFSNLNIGNYNLHHLYTGAFLLVIIFILLLFDIINKYTLILGGIFSAFILDELVYLIFTDGSDLSYLTPISFYGGLIFVFLVLLFIIILYYFKK
ncbi:hypothetical protein J4216_04480 [Candidatus Woesearchaeota archaeon]|nr:hypothetical protein [Candidatus Woesearchaeota archaeon]